MKIDTTLKSFLVPDLQEYIPPFGTKVIRNAINNGGLSTQEVNDNIMMPFAKQRPLVVTEDSETDSIEYNAIFVINKENIKLALKDAFIGCVIKILFAKNGKIEYTNVFGETNIDEILKSRTTEYTYTGDGWFCSSAPAIKSKVEQYPTDPEPAAIYGGQWQDVSPAFAGLFARIAGGDAEEFNKQLEVLSNDGTTLTFADGHNLTVGSLLIDCLGENPTYEQRDILSVNGNTVTISAAFSTTLTNILIGQNDGLPNITGTLNGDDPNAVNVYTGSFTLTNKQSAGQGAISGTDRMATFNAKNGETKTDGTLKTSSAHKVFGSSNFVTPKNITIKLWKRIS